ncbi:urea ABC transporter permease subunit UrtC [Cohnella zeiphila]|uniref:Urea ABC transporter permease subunit UrtC n=1 Tax=Cohnella zeiphila TaxID=2761120 RepID=A0A7X0SH38_9BACL|nr:urea ABC transporter permease subunit UrtC [Cohnella zeiphila]MBB6729875.1 urea ABC transporter permease subunit UrtC [Cohnella zeiphila]
MLLKNATVRRKIVITLAYAAVVALLACAPMFLSDFRLNLLGKFLAYGVVALGLDLIWGYTGILSLGHGIFFGIGAYCMAMYLKLEATGAGRLPDFMQWSGVTSLPWFWEPFRFFGVALLLSVLLPMLLALLLGFFTFRNRIRGVYFTILTQALVLIVVTLMIGQQAYTGGTNGITGFRHVLGFSLASPSVKNGLYYISAAALVGSFLLCRRLVRGPFGKVLQAVRDGQNRLRFLGYDPAKYQMFVFTVSAGLAGLAGVLFVLQVGIISPSMMDIVPSIEMVLWVAIGGRGSLIGAAAGALLINASKSGLSETYPDFWTFLLGGLFIVVVVFLPKGLFGLLARLGARMKGGLGDAMAGGRGRAVVGEDHR